MNWIEKKLFDERRARRLPVVCALCLLTFFLLLAVWARLNGPERLDTRAAMEAFCQSEGGPNASLAYEQAQWLGECTLTETQTHTLSMLGAGYIGAPVGTTERETTRQVYLLTGADWRALLLSDGELADGGKVPSVRHEGEVDESVRAAFGEGEATFVLLTSTGTLGWTVVWVLLLLVALLGLGLLLSRRSHWLMRHTRLGGLLKQAGDFEATLQALSAEAPRFDAGGLTLTDRWVFVRHMEGMNRVRWAMYPAGGLQALLEPDDGEYRLRLSLPGQGEIACLYLDEAQAAQWMKSGVQ